MDYGIIKQGCQSYELKMFNLYLLMYADDTVLFSENVHELQNMINVVNVCSNEYNLHVNLLKTKIVIYRNRGNIKSEEGKISVEALSIISHGGCHVFFYHFSSDLILPRFL
jgi:hypothetical protein